MCGLRVQVEGSRVTQIRANPDDVWSRGYLCPKGTTLGEVHHDPDRLRAPLVREGAGWREVSWAEAFREVARRLRPLLAEHGKEAVTAYIGNPTAHNFSLSRYVAAFAPSISRKSVRSRSGTGIAHMPPNISALVRFFGHWSTVPAE